MQTLTDHFGENANLRRTTTRELSNWLIANSADTVDINLAHVLTRVNPAYPITLTKTPFWLATHDPIDAASFNRAPIYSHSYCAACHSDAESGGFTSAISTFPTPPNPLPTRAGASVMSHRTKSQEVLELTVALVAAFFALIAAFSPANAGPKQDAVIAKLATEAGVSSFSAQNGEAFCQGTHKGGKPETPSCTTCHTKNPRNMGKTRVGKPIEPMAVSANPARFINPEKLAKWFQRNCKTVLSCEWYNHREG